MSANEPRNVKEADEIAKSNWATTRQKANALAYLLRKEGECYVPLALAHLLEHMGWPR